MVKRKKSAYRIKNEKIHKLYQFCPKKREREKKSIKLLKVEKLIRELVVSI